MGNKREREREREGYWERKQWKSERVNAWEREREGDSESKWDRQTDRLTDRQTDRQTDRHCEIGRINTMRLLRLICTITRYYSYLLYMFIIYE